MAGDTPPIGKRPKSTGTAKSKEALRLRGTVSEYFDVYDIRWDTSTYAFYIHVYDSDYGDKFEKLRSELKKRDYLPKLVNDKGEFVIYIQRNPPQKFKGKVTNLVVFLLTIVSTVWAGAVIWAPFDGFVPDTIPRMMSVFVNPEYMFYGAVYYALPLILILGVHEFGHYFMSKRHNVNASLPFFIPIPPILGPLGTLGAFISLREPIPNKKALLEIGAAGPIAGFIVAIPVTLIGLYLTAADPCYCPGLGGMEMLIKEPLLFFLFTRIIEVPAGATLHPVAFAGWVGLLVTAINLLPAGQLDGGHIVRALFGERAKYLSYGVIVALVALAIYTQFLMWGLFALFILFMGPKHPPPLNDLSPLKHTDKIVGVACAVIMIFCFHPLPLTIDTSVDPVYDLNLSIDSSFKTIGPNQTAFFEMNLTNTGNQNDDFILTYEFMALDSNAFGFDIIVTDLTNFTVVDTNGAETSMAGWDIRTPSNKTISLGENEGISLQVRVAATDSIPVGSGIAFRVRAESVNDPGIKEELLNYAKLNTFGFKALESQGLVIRKTIAPYTLVIMNTDDASNLEVTLSYKVIREDAPTRGWGVELNRTALLVRPGDSGYVNVYVRAPAEVFKGNTFVVRVYAADIATGETAMTDLTTVVEQTEIIE